MPVRHPVTGRFLSGDCEKDCQTACAGLCGQGMGPPVPLEDLPWNDQGGFMVQFKSKDVGEGAGNDRGKLFFLAYSDEPNPDGQVCNSIRSDGSVCRLMRGHHEEEDVSPYRPHLPFSPILVAQSGVYVTDVYDPANVSRETP